VTITDQNGCTTSSNIEVTTCECEEIDLPVDGTFDSCSGSTEYGVINGNVTCAGYMNGVGTADSWSPPLSPNSNQGSNLSGIAQGMPESPQGGTFAGAGAWFNGESFYTTIEVAQGNEYTVSFYQANAGNGPDASSSSQTPIGELASWDLIFDGETQTTPSLPYEGAGNQTWSLVELTFTSYTNGPVVLEFRNSGALGGGNLTQYYMAADGILVTEECPGANSNAVVNQPVHSIDIQTTNIEEVKSDKLDRLVELYPNPASQFVNIKQNSTSRYDLRILSYTGHEIRTLSQISTQEFKLEVSDLVSGLYLMEFFIEDKRIIKKLIIE